MKQVQSFGIPQSIRLLSLLFFLVFCPYAADAQSSPETTPTADVVQPRIERARALVAAHQLETAATELESVRASTKDASIRTITSVMLMNIYLEAGNYGRAEALLDESFKSRGDQSGGEYFALAGQAINGARLHLARYRALGINTSAANLPAEAVTDLDRLRSFLERMIVHAKDIAKERRAYDSLSLVEDVLGIRLSLSKDGEEQAKWQGEYSSAREQLASHSQIASRNGITALPAKAPAIKAESPYSTRRPSEERPANTPEEAKPTTPTATSGPSTPADTSTGDKIADFGLLNFKASKRVVPRYPPLAKQTGTAGLVRVHVIVDQTGKVIQVSKTEGPVLLRQVAEDAARGWYFEGIAGPGQAVRFTGYIDFNFTL